MLSMGSECRIQNLTVWVWTPALPFLAGAPRTGASVVPGASGVHPWTPCMARALRWRVGRGLAGRGAPPGLAVLNLFSSFLTFKRNLFRFFTSLKMVFLGYCYEYCCLGVTFREVSEDGEQVTGRSWRLVS